MTTIIDNVQLQPLVNSLRELHSPLFLVNGKLEHINRSSDQRHVFRFVEIIASLTKHTISENIFTEAFLQFQYLNDLLQESHSNDMSFNNDDMLAYFLAMLDTTLTIHGKELQMKHIHRILKFWGVDKDLDVFSRKLTQAKTILDNAGLLRDNSRKCTEELLSKANLLFSYLKDIFPHQTYQLEQIFERIEILVQKKILPYASISNAALIMIVSFFPLYLEMPAVKLCIMLQLKKDLNINLTNLKKDVERFQNKLEKYDMLK